VWYFSFRVTPFSSSSNWDGDDLSEGPLFDFPITYPYDNEELGQYPLPDDDISLDIPNDNISKSNKVMVIKHISYLFDKVICLNVSVC
jgi:hypothetical protein